MVPRMQTAGTAGVITGIALAVLFLLFFTSGITPATFGDPGMMLSYIGKNSTRTWATTVVALVAVAFAVVFVAGLAGKLRDKTPTRAVAVLYFGILALAGHALTSLIFTISGQAVAAYAAKDQVAASHAWVAVAALSGATQGAGNLFYGLSTLMAGWAITASKVLSSTLGWLGVISGALGILVFLFPMAGPLFPLSFSVQIVWVIWAGSTLRKA